jgi:hypothetical protein
MAGAAARHLDQRRLGKPAKERSWRRLGRPAATRSWRRVGRPTVSMTSDVHRGCRPPAADSQRRLGRPVAHERKRPTIRRSKPTSLNEEADGIERLEDHRSSATGIFLGAHTGTCWRLDLFGGLKLVVPR